MVVIRRAKSEEVSRIGEVYAQARQFMEKTGNPDQWKNGYPNQKLIMQDIEAGQLFVCLEGDKLLGVFVFFLGGEPSYEEIREGRWLNGEPYGTIHRVAVVDKGRGLIHEFLGWCWKNCQNLRIDTHEKNLPMQRALEKNGFQRCGYVTAEDGTERIAYHKCE